MKTSQVDLPNNIHQKMKEIVLKEQITNKEFIMQAVVEKIERYEKKRK